jgi:hypothetical protein
LLTYFCFRKPEAGRTVTVRNINNTMRIRHLYFYILLFFSLFTFTAYAQVWPGDVNGNGEVNNVDLIFLGSVFGHTGPKRLVTSTEWSEQYLPAEWTDSFPGGANWAHADCNGDGLIDEQDLITILVNFGETRPGFEPDDFTEGFPNIDPTLAFNPSQIEDAYALGSQVKDLIIELGSSVIPVDDLLGIAFTIEYNPDVIQEGSIQLDLDDNWISTDASEAFFGQQAPVPGEVQVALSRFGANPVGGNGVIASLSYIIIEDNLIGLQAEDTSSTVLCIKDVKLINSFLEETPVATDCLEVGLFDPTLVNLFNQAAGENSIQVFPNPADERLFIYPIEAGSDIRIFNLLGNEILQTKVAGQNGPVDISSLPKGIYFLQTSTGGELIKFLKK